MDAPSNFYWLLDQAVRDSCLPLAALDGESVAEDDRISCDMVTIHDSVVRNLPLCSGSAWYAAQPCWQLFSDSSCGSGWGLLLGGGYLKYAPRIVGRCAVH